MVLDRLRITLAAIRFSHSIFALPFALLGAFLAAGGPPPLVVVGLIVTAAVGARTAAMAFNRLVDRRIDAANPRTRDRELPSGRLSAAWMASLVFLGSAVLVLSAWGLNPLCLALSGPTLVIVLGYSLTKRFTAGSHFFLGLALGIAPVGAWIAVTGAFDRLPFILAAAVTFWTAGFDILYSLQDEEFDRENDLHSIPARLGPARAILVSRALHLATFSLLLVAWSWSGLGGVFLGGVLAAGALLAWEQSLVSATDLSRLDAAFFTANGMVSVVLFLTAALDLALA